MSSNKAKDRTRWQWYLLISMFLCILMVYVGGYWWARQTGLFVGEIKTFDTYAGTREFEIYEINPMGYFALGLSRDAYATEAEYRQDENQLRSEQELSVTLWRFYWPLAKVEEFFR